jgi:predicted  nucleic acid-binding Zn-ribbon protein
MSDREQSDHKEFEQLGALAVTGDLDAEEFRRLGEHLYECDSCRAAYRDFQAIIDCGFPVLERRRRGWVMPHPRLKKRFTARAVQEGILIEQPKSRRWTRASILIPAAAAVLLVVGLGSYGWRLHRIVQEERGQTAARIVALSTQIAQLQARLAEIRKPLPATPPKAAVAGREVEREKLDAQLGWWRIPESPSNPQRQLEHLRAQHAAAVAARGDLEERLRMLSAELEQQSADAQTSRAEVERLHRSSQQAQSALSQAQRDVEALRKTASTDNVMMAQQRARIDELAATIRQQAETIDRDRVLLAAGKPIRDLMGARNLRIVDVEDHGTPGKVRPLAARIFYTKDKSLIFYAYDLPNKGNVNQVAFQVWGKREGRSQAPRNLGLLYPDNSTQNRWALKFEDPDVLAQIDQVFVTVEPPGGSRQPTGKPLLAAAFLNEPSNHP